SHVAALTASPDHRALHAVQPSATSHEPAEARHSTVEAWKASAGQVLFTPSHVSATSHEPAEARHWAVLFASAGHVALEPVQVSATSHTTAEPPHSALEGLRWSDG